MTVSATTSAPSAPPPVAAPRAGATSSTGRAADGDYVARNSKSATTKDADGDYKPATKAAASTPAASASSPAQVALATLKLGG